MAIQLITNAENLDKSLIPIPVANSAI